MLRIAVFTARSRCGRSSVPGRFFSWKACLSILYCYGVMDMSEVSGTQIIQTAESTGLVVRSLPLGQDRAWDYRTRVATVPMGLSTNSIIPCTMFSRAGSEATFLPAK